MKDVDIKYLKELANQFVSNHPIARLDCFKSLVDEKQVVITLYLSDKKAWTQAYYINELVMDDLEELYQLGMYSVSKNEKLATLPNDDIKAYQLKRIYTVSGNSSDLIVSDVIIDKTDEVMQDPDRDSTYYWREGYNEGFMDALRIARNLSPDTIQRLLDSKK